jgi:hypothetical protein
MRSKKRRLDKNNADKKTYKQGNSSGHFADKKAIIFNRRPGGNDTTVNFTL